MSKLFLIFFSVLAIAAIVSAWDNDEDTSLSKELAPSRLVRSADILTDTTTGPADTTPDPTATTTTTTKVFLFNFLSMSLGIYISLSQSMSVGQSVKVYDT